MACGCKLCKSIFSLEPKSLQFLRPAYIDKQTTIII